MNEPLEVDAATGGIERLAVEIEREDVLRVHQSRRHVARQQEMRGRRVVTHAHVAEAVDDALVVEDPVRQRELRDERRARGRR